jgi:hypothetical protein
MGDAVTPLGQDLQVRVDDVKAFQRTVEFLSRKTIAECHISIRCD